ncbi:MAG: VanZ family protein [Clostridium sp.]|nr:VanZ family protein [Clostridium sp.]
MHKILKTLYHNVGIFFDEYFIIPFLFSVILTLILLILFSLKSKRKKIQHYATIFALIFYFAELFYTTIIFRIGSKTNPLADVFGEWLIYDGETSMYINPKPILNIILFLPMCFAVFYIAKYLVKKPLTNKRMLTVVTAVSFAVSLCIELTQLIFSIGSFQISDLVYNTLGGLIGAVLYITVKHIIKNKTRT